jgi:hypothetical protein
MIARNHIRAARYRALALTEKDQARANLLDRLACEAEHGVLCTVRHLRLVHSAETERTAPARDASDNFNFTVAAPMI